MWIAWWNRDRRKFVPPMKWKTMSQFTNKIDIQFGQVFETWSTWQESTWERGRCHNPSGMLIFLCSFVALSLTKVASTPFNRSLGGCRLTLEFRLSVANDKIGAILLTSLQSPHRNFRASDGLFMPLLYWNSPPFPSAWFLQWDARWSRRIWSHEPKFSFT